MNLSWAINRGIHFGAILGAGFALASLLDYFPLEGIPQANSFVSAAIGFAKGTLLGAGLGAIAFGTLHGIVHTIPGLATLLGDVPPHPSRQKSRSMPVEMPKTRAPSAKVQPELDEASNRFTGFQRMIEEERIQDLQQQQQEMGR